MKKIVITLAVLAGLFVNANETKSVMDKITDKVNDVKNNQEYNSTAIFKSYYSEKATKSRKDLFYFVRPAKRKVHVGEPIQISFKLRKKAYIYIVAISKKDGDAYLLFPNDAQSYNLFRSRIHYVMPERSARYRLVSDSRGIETVYIIASTHKQDFDGLSRIFEAKDEKISTKKIEGTLKDIFIIPAKRNRSNVEISKLNIRVR